MSAVLPTTPRSSTSSGRQTNSSPPASISPRQWRKLDPQHQRALEHYIDLESKAPKGRLPSYSTIFSFKTGEEVVDAVASALIRLCDVKHSRMEETFRCAARVTELTPKVVLDMTAATSWQELCQAIPKHARRACGQHVVDGATVRKPAPVTAPSSTPEAMSLEERYRRQFGGVVPGNAHQFA